jgi:hypothetical protein
MCRISFDPHPELRGEEILEEQFSTLTRLAGGEGQGIAFLDDRRVIKGVEMTSEQLAREVMATPQPFIYHTRRASIGEINDSLCQPFLFPPIIVAHNGHWTRYLAGMENLLRANKLKFVPFHMSDSMVGAFSARAWGTGVLHQLGAQGVWLVSKIDREGKGTLMAVVNSGDFAINCTTGQAASVPVAWEKGDEVVYAKPGSVISLWPRRELIVGEVSFKPLFSIGGKKKGKG